MKSEKALPIAILAGGLATRLGSLTKDTPKSLIPVASRPFIDYQLKLLASRGADRVVLCVGHLGETIRDHVGDGARFGLDVRYSFDGEKLLGTGGAVRNALPLLGDRFMTLYGDSYLDLDYAGMSALFVESGAPAMMSVYRNEGRWDRSNVVFADGKILVYDKKLDLPEMKHIDAGALAFRREAFDPFPEGEPFDLAEVCSRCVKAGQLAAYESPNRFYEIGSVEGIRELEALLADAPT